MGRAEGADERDRVAREGAGGVQGAGWGSSVQMAGGKHLFEEDAASGVGGSVDDWFVFVEAGIPCDHEVIEERDCAETAVRGHHREAGQSDFSFCAQGCEGGGGFRGSDYAEVVERAVQGHSGEAVGAEEAEAVFDTVADGTGAEIPAGASVFEGFAGFCEDEEVVLPVGEELADSCFREAVGWGGVEDIDAGCGGVIQKSVEDGVVWKFERGMLEAFGAAPFDGTDAERRAGDAGEAERLRGEWFHREIHDDVSHG